MKKLIILSIAVTFTFLSCTGKKEPVQQIELQQEIQIEDEKPEVQEEKKPEIIEQQVEIPKPVEEKKEEVQPIIEEKSEPPIIEEKAEELPKVEEEVVEPPKVEEIVETPKVEENDDEYSRSIGNVEISKDTFVEDKATILGIIDELATIMKDKNYKRWVSYLDSTSISYWSKSANLKKAQSRLPVKGLQLKTLEDYFKFIFVPARQNHTVSEIRYISENYVKAIDVMEDNDYVYYYFNKINGKWMVNLPVLED